MTLTTAARMTLPEPQPRRLHLALELSKSSWGIAMSDGGQRVLINGVQPGDDEGLLKKIAQAKKRLDLPGDAEVYSCHEAGRDAFWVHRFLARLAIKNVVVDAASMKVDRRARRAKSDRLDVRQLLADLVRHHRGDKNVWSVVHVPDEEEEDDRRLHRGLERLKKERTSLRSRLSSLLATEGIHSIPRDGALRNAATLRNWAGAPLLPGLASDIARTMERVDLVESQIQAIEKEQKDRARHPDTPAMEKIDRLSCLRGIGLDSAWLLVMEFFAFRNFANRRQVGGAAGLGGTPYSSGQTTREQGISKAGNARVRTRMIELAWMWIRLQPESKRTKWFQQRFGGGAKRGRRRGIVGLARMLLIDLWHFVEHGVVPPGAELKPAMP